MAEQLLFWVVTRDGKGKWAVSYDPRESIKDGKRFAFQVRADEYEKKMEKKDEEARKALAATQKDLL